MDEDNKKNAQDREEQGYGYDKSVEDLKVIGQNNRAKDDKEHNQKKKKK